MGIIGVFANITNSFIIPEGCVERFAPYLSSECVALAEAFIGPLGITTLLAEMVVLHLQRELAMSDSPHERKVRQCLEDL